MNISFQRLNRKISLKKILFTFIFLFLLVSSFSQEFRIKCFDKPLNNILISLRDSTGIMVSFDDKQLSSYRLTVDKQFSSISEAFDYLFMNLPFGYEISDGVYIIYYVRIKKIPKKYILIGRIRDKTNLETLPFSSVIVNNTGFISDSNGSFSFSSTEDSIFKIKISYLGYYIHDTIVTAGIDYDFLLTPSVIAFDAVVIEGSNIARTIQTGLSPGISRLNHKIAYFLPGNGDNSIFNLLRLQPGILASGEQSSDLVIWGSYEGQSHVIFDGFTLFGLKNFNDNISAVNPFMAKDIKVSKGGYGVEYGERVGGIVDITGVDGNMLSPSAQVCINNMTLNGLFSVPFRKNAALTLAYRQTYYELYNPVKLASKAPRRAKKIGEADYYAYPDYGFRDFNMKFSGKGRRYHYYISLYGGNDDFSYSFDQLSFPNDISFDYQEKNFQMGAAASYGIRWKGEMSSDLTISHSSLHADRDEDKTVEKLVGNNNFFSFSEKTRSIINEFNTRLTNKFSMAENHKAEVGAGLLCYTIAHDGIYQDSIIDTDTQLILPNFYLQDKILLFNKLTLNPGIRIDYHTLSEEIYFQPRFSVLYRINDYLRLNSGL